MEEEDVSDAFIRALDVLKDLLSASGVGPRYATADARFVQWVTRGHTLAHLFLCSDVTSVQLVVKDMSNFRHINKPYGKLFGLNPPARVCVELPLPPRVVAVLNCTAIAPDEHSRRLRHMHVQGLSHWAPANIGPYSQAVQAGSVLFLAGQIGLDPASMSLVKGFEQQVRGCSARWCKVSHHLLRCGLGTGKHTPLSSRFVTLLV